jgi:hypothetical protein
VFHLPSQTVSSSFCHTTTRDLTFSPEERSGRPRDSSIEAFSAFTTPNATCLGYRAPRTFHIRGILGYVVRRRTVGLIPRATTIVGGCVVAMRSNAHTKCKCSNEIQLLLCSPLENSVGSFQISDARRDFAFSQETIYLGPSAPHYSRAAPLLAHGGKTRPPHTESRQASKGRRRRHKRKGGRKIKHTFIVGNPSTSCLAHSRLFSSASRSTA